MADAVSANALLSDPRQARVLEWELTAPAQRKPPTQEALAAELGVSPRTVRGWKEKPEFQAAWRIAFVQVAGSLERTKAILDQLFNDSQDEKNSSRVAAAKLHWDISRAIAPPEPEAHVSRRARELSDVELVEMLSRAALDELEARGLVVKVGV